MTPELRSPTIRAMRSSVSTGRWAVASFSAGVALLALTALPFTAWLAGSETFRQTAFAVVVIVVACGLVIVVALDLLGARGRPVTGRGLHGIR
jgi:hypothetical protein